MSDADSARGGPAERRGGRRKRSDPQDEAQRGAGGEGPSARQEQGEGGDEDLERLRPGFSKFDENHSFPRSSPGAAGSTHACNPGNLMTEFLKIGEEDKILKAAKEK